MLASLCGKKLESRPKNGAVNAVFWHIHNILKRFDIHTVIPSKGNWVKFYEIYFNISRSHVGSYYTVKNNLELFTD